VGRGGFGEGGGGGREGVWGLIGRGVVVGLRALWVQLRNQWIDLIARIQGSRVAPVSFANSSAWW